MTDADNLPFAPSCERNKEVILETLKQPFADRKHLLEVGSGTAQHAVHFAKAIPHLCWQCTEVAENLGNLLPRINIAQLTNLPNPLELNALTPDTFTAQNFDSFFTANTLHIMSWDAVISMINWLPKVLINGAKIAIYGPFHYHGQPTSEGNRDFDISLKAKPGEMGIRDFEAVDNAMRQQGFNLLEDCAMPANNRLIFWQKD